ncbi:MAG: hypothetical protein J6A75_05420 [Lachnospiraceae bacterium]|nr:hypothetical protein [Lachnospiraceae bacterium]
MFETAPDIPDIEEYESEQDRLHRMRKRIAHEYDLADERMDEEYEFI